jgi:hypothetical protein
MKRTLAVVILAGLTACTSSSAWPEWQRNMPVYSGARPAPAPADDAAALAEVGAPKETTLPVGIGMTFGPNSTLVGAALDFNVDKKITFGPAVQYGFDEARTLLAVTGQVKYFIPLGDDNKPMFLGYLTGGVGFANIDKDGRSSDDGLLLDVGFGLRMRTGDNYLLGSELRWNFLPDSLAGESSYFSFEFLQIVISF